MISHNLPDGYVELQWIESTGTQHINTAYSGNGYRIKTKFYITEWTNTYSAYDCYFSGFYSSSSPFRNYLVIYQQKWNIGGTNDVLSSSSAQLNTWYDMDASTISSSQYINIDGVNVVTANDTHSNGIIYLFKVNGLGALAKCRMKIVEMYDSSNALIRNFIPCINPNSEVGMYDLVSDTFFTNQGTGSFIAGPVVPSNKIYGDSVKIGKAENASIFVTGLEQSGNTVYASKDGKTVNGKWVDYQIPNPAWHGLPSGYQELEYIGGNGNSYLNTGLLVSGAYRVKLRGKFTSSVQNDTWLCGDWSSNRCYLIGYYQTLKIKIGDDDIGHAANISFDTNWHTYEVTSNQLLIDNVASSYAPNWSMLPTTGRTIPLFKSFHTNQSTVERYISIAEFRNPDGDLVRNFIPCQRLSDSAIGMYDLVSNTFFGNAGTGTFIAGDVVPQYLTYTGFMIKPINQYGTWVVTATDGTRTNTKDVLVDSAEMYEIEMSYKTYLIRNGVAIVSIYTSTNANQDYSWSRKNPSISYGDGYTRINLQTNYSKTGVRGSVYYNPIDMTNYKTLCIDCYAYMEPHSNNGWANITSGLVSNYTYTYSYDVSTGLVDQNNAIYSFDGIKSIDISDIQSNEYIVLGFSSDPTGTTSGDYYTRVDIRNLWLE